MKQTARIIRNNVPYTLLSNGAIYGEPIHVPSVTSARLLPDPPPPAISIGSAGETVTGTYYWDSASTATDDGQTVIKVTAITTGRYKPVSVAIGGSGSFLSVATPTALKAIVSTALTDTQPASILTPGSNWAWSASTGAGFESDDITVIRPNDVFLGSNGRWYNTSPAPVVATYAAARLAVSGKQPTISIQARSSLNDGGGGIFDYDSTDMTSADDGALTLVAGTRRYKRRFSGALDVRWFGAKADLTHFTSVSISASATTFTKAGFSTSDIGKNIIFSAAGTAGGQHVTTITNVSGSTVTIANAAVTTQTGGHAWVFTNDSSAIQACIDAAFALRSTMLSGPAGTTSLAMPTVMFGIGHGILSSLESSSGCHYLGQPSTIWAPSTVDIITGVRYGDRFTNINFQGGANQVTIGTGNADTTTLRFYDCEFLSMSDSGIRSDDNSMSTCLSLNGGKFSDISATAHAVSMITGDKWNLNDFWVSTNSTETFVIGESGSSDMPKLHISGMLGVPGGATWYKFYNGHLVVEGSRHGGEGATSILDCHAHLDSSYPVIPSVVSFSGCDLFALDKPFRFYGLPNVFSVTDCGGLPNSPSQGIYLDATIPSADRIAFGQYGQMRWDGVQPTLNLFDSDSDQAAVQLVAATTRHSKASAVNIEDRVLSVRVDNAGLGLSASATNTTIGAGTDSFGNPTETITATADGAIRTITHTTALASLSTGLYTFKVTIEVDSAVKVEVIAANTIKLFELLPGRHVICLPFYFSSGTSDESIGMAFRDLPNGSVSEHGMRVVYSGDVRVTTDHEQILASATPTHDDTMPFAKGAVLINRSPSTANAFMWRVTTAGTHSGGAEVWEPLKNIDPDSAWPGTNFILASGGALKVGNIHQPSTGALRFSRVDETGASVIMQRNHADANDLAIYQTDTSDSQIWGSQLSGGAYLNSGGDYLFRNGGGFATVFKVDATNSKVSVPNGNGLSHPAYSFLNSGALGMALIGTDNGALVANGTKFVEWGRVAGQDVLAFFGGSVISKPTVSGVKSDTVAGNLVAALALLGLITDSTT